MVRMVYPLLSVYPHLGNVLVYGCEREQPLSLKIMGVTWVA